MAKKKYNVELLTIVQIQSTEIDKTILSALRERATYIDTDKTLNEFLITTDEILTLCNEYGTNDKTLLADIAFDLYQQLKNHNYLQVTYI